MKNLSLQMSDTTSLKKPAETINKNNAGVSSATSIENNASFQMMLNKQVQANHVSTQDAQTKQDQAQKHIAKITEPKETASASAKTESADPISDQKNAQKSSHLQIMGTAKNYTKIIKDSENLNSVTSASKELIEPKAKSVLEKKNNEDSKLENAATSATDSISAAVALLPSVIIENKQFTSSSSQNAELTATNETLSEKQLSVGAEIRDMVLNNALSQGKNSNISEVQDIAAGDAKLPQNNWIDTMLPIASGKQINSDETAKLMLNALKEGTSKEMLIKETSIKDVAMPANFQSTTQTHAAEAMQQVGSGNVISAYPGKSGWDQAISQKVVWMLGAQEQSATLTLNPPDLGPLQVVIHVHNDQADTTFTSDNAEVRQALQDGMANLREKMSESGIQLGQANVNSGGQMQQQFQQESQQSNYGSKLNSNVAASQSEVKISSHQILRATNGLVDTFV
jgi:flagellar hook-length control protein FliK